MTDDIFFSNRLDEFSKSMKQSIPVKEIKNGYFSKISNVVSGAELYDWIEKHISSSDDAYKRKICQDLLDHEFIHSVQQSRAFTPDHFSYYIFQCDLPNQAINKVALIIKFTLLNFYEFFFLDETLAL